MPKVKALIIDKHNVLIGGNKGSGRVQINNGIPADLVIDAYGLDAIHIKNVHKNLFPYLREMYPEEFGPDVDKYMDRVDDAVRANEKEQRSHIRSEEWFEGYEAAVEIMQQSMNEITEELKHADKG